MSIRPLVLPAALAITAIGIIAAPKLPPLQATWRSSAITIDGADADWPMPAVSPFEGQPISMSVQNDGDSVFVRLRTSDHAAIQQVLRGGLVLWFDPRGGDKRVFGVKYPVGAALTEEDLKRRPARPRDGGMPLEGERPEGGDGRTAPRQDGTSRLQLPSNADLVRLVPRRLELLSEKKDEQRSLVLDYADGIGVAVAIAEGSLVYELSMPLVRRTDVVGAVGAAPGTVIGIGIETLKIELPDTPGGRPPGGMGMPGGAGGRGGSGGGMGGRGSTSRFADMPKPWKAWTQVQLARPPR